MLFIADADARPSGAAHPLASLWDNGDDPIAMLRHEMEVRRIGLSQFGLASVPAGTPLSLLEAKLLPLYLHHRYQLQAAVKSIGGVYYTYAVKTASGANPGKVRRNRLARAPARRARRGSRNAQSRNTRDPAADTRSDSSARLWLRRRRD